MTVEPSFATEPVSNGLKLRLNGRWTIAAPGLERQADALLAATRARRSIIFDLTALEAMDTTGAWLIDRARHSVAKAGGQSVLEGARAEHDILLGEAHYRSFEKIG